MKGVLRLAAGAALLSACAPVPPTDGAPLAGTWGGTHIGLTLTPTGGLLDYDCGAGTIAGPLILAPGGEFRAVGTHTPGTGGPERMGEGRPSYPADYRGRIIGDRMTLVVHVPALGAPEASYALQRGAAPTLLRCL